MLKARKARTISSLGLRSFSSARNHASALVGIGRVGRDIDRFIAQVLDETAADGRVLDEKRRGDVGAIASLNLHYLLFKRVKQKPTTDHLEHVEDFLAPQQNDTSRIVAGFGLAQSDVP